VLAEGALQISCRSVREIRIAFQRRHFCNPDRLAAVRAVDGEKPFPLFNGFDHGFRLIVSRSRMLTKVIDGPRRALSFNHLVGAGEEGGRCVET
jgi:hypothetical protein